MLRTFDHCIRVFQNVLVHFSISWSLVKNHVSVIQKSIQTCISSYHLISPFFCSRNQGVPVIFYPFPTATSGLSSWRLDWLSLSFCQAVRWAKSLCLCKRRVENASVEGLLFLNQSCQSLIHDHGDQRCTNSQSCIPFFGWRGILRGWTEICLSSYYDFTQPGHVFFWWPFWKYLHHFNDGRRCNLHLPTVAEFQVFARSTASKMVLFVAHADTRARESQGLPVGFTHWRQHRQLFPGQTPLHWSSLRPCVFTGAP